MFSGLRKVQSKHTFISGVNILINLYAFIFYLFYYHVLDANVDFSYRHFRPAIGISKKAPVVLRVLELEKEQLQKRTCLDSQPVDDAFEKSISEKRAPCVI